MAGRRRQQPLEVATTALTSVDGGATMAHRVVERIGEDGRVELVVEGIGSSVDPAGITSLSRLIAWWTRERARLLEATAHSHAPVVPLPPKGGRPDALVACLACEGESWESCSLCRGRGTVTAQAAEGWRVERYGGGDG